MALDWRGQVRPSMTWQHLALTWQRGGMDLTALGTRLVWCTHRARRRRYVAADIGCVGLRSPWCYIASEELCTHGPLWAGMVWCASVAYEQQFTGGVGLRAPWYHTVSGTRTCRGSSHGSSLAVFGWCAISFHFWRPLHALVRDRWCCMDQPVAQCWQSLARLDLFA